MAEQSVTRRLAAILAFDDDVADGLTENVIASLSKLDEMFVIARTSTLVYRGKPVKVQRVAQELARTFATEWLKVL